MHLYLIRHAQSANNALYAAAGVSGYDAGRVADPPLTELGHAQARLLARHLASGPDALGADNEVSSSARRHNRDGFGLTHLYTSLMLRAIVTAGYVAEATGLPLHAWPEAHERGGLYQHAPETGEAIIVAGPNRAHFAGEFPHLRLPDTLGDAGWWGRGRETEDEFVPRAQTFWRQLAERHGEGEDRVAVITHAGFFQSLMAALTTGPAEGTGMALRWFGMSNTSISRFELNEGMIDVRYLNRVEHLPAELITG